MAYNRHNDIEHLSHLQFDRIANITGIDTKNCTTDSLATNYTTGCLGTRLRQILY